MNNDKDVRIKINEIHRQLWLGHASLMVGCGFSRNADKVTPMTPLPPDWKALAAAFASRLYSSYDKAYIDNIIQCKNALQLAQEFDVAFHRPALNMLLKDLIQDDNLLPNSLYIKMLDLPWIDVFTTNYDTLLEKASKLVINKKFDVVYGCQDLPYSESPRIIKLHGSFLTEATHLIVTEEDYRTYPDEYSPFVNTVQQAIMESALCLVGFSGTDPNFLRWIGWVKDNLKASMPPIYLVGLLNLPESEEKVLAKKNIVTIDLAALEGGTINDHAMALDKFFDILNDKPTYIDWFPGCASGSLLPPKDTNSDNIIKIIEDWERERNSYPNWLVLPWDKRSALVQATQLWTSSLDYLTRLPSPWDLKGLFELNWRIEKCLMPISNTLISQYESILNKYAAFSTSENIENTSEDFQLQLRELYFSLLRWSREELDSERWSQYEAILIKIILLDINSQNRLYYEQAMHAMAIPCLSQLDEILKAWDKIEHPFEWSMKYAAILSELGQTDKAVSLLTIALKDLIPYIPKSKIKNDYYLLSLEGNILISLCMAETHKTCNTGAASGGLRKKYSCRLKELEQYDCNPWENIDRFQLTLSVPEKKEEIEREKRNFDHCVKTRHYTNGWNLEPLRAFQLLRFFEETGIPLYLGYTTIGKDALIGAISRIINYAPLWAFYVFNRIGETNGISCELFYSQERLYHIAPDRIDQLAETYTAQLKYIITNKKSHLTRLSNDFYKRVAQNLLETISRLTARASAKVLQKIFDLGIAIYNSDIVDKNFIFNNMGYDYFARLLDAMSPEDIFKNLNTLLSITIPNNNSNRMCWQNPVHINWRNYKKSYSACSPELIETVNMLIQQLDTDDVQIRSDVLLYLNACWTLNILSSAQKRIIARSLVKHARVGELPSGNTFYKFAYKEFLSPLRRQYNVIQALKDYYTSFDFKFCKITGESVRFSTMHESGIKEFSYSLSQSSSVFQKRTSHYIELEPEECLVIFEHLCNAWKDAEHVISKKLREDNDIGREFKLYIADCFFWCDMVLGEVIIPRIIDVHSLTAIEDFVKNVDPIIALPSSRVALAIHKKKYPDELIYDILSALGQSDKTVFDAFSFALFNAYRFAKKKQLPVPPSTILDALLNAIGMKSDITFKSACYRLGDIMKYFVLPNKKEKLLLRYMIPLDSDTSFLSDSTRFPLSNRFDYRLAVAYLAAVLYKSYLRRKISDIPLELQTWHKICNSDIELHALKNIWIQEMNYD